MKGRVFTPESTPFHLNPFALRKAKLYTILAFLSVIGLIKIYNRIREYKSSR